MKKLLNLILIIFLSTFVSAYNGYRYWSPSQLLENEWVVFALVFLGFFALVFFALNRTMRGNTGAAVLISAIMAFFAAAAISYRTRFYGYFGESIGGWIISILLIILFILFIKALVNILGGWTLFASLFGLWYLVNRFEPYDFLPYEISETILPVYGFLASGFFLFIIIIALIISLIALKNRRFRKWFLVGKERRKFNFRAIADEIFGD